MKQILICKADAEYASDANPFDATTVEDGSIAFVDLKYNEVITGTPEGNFSIILGRPANKQPFIIPEVDVKSLTVAVAEYQPGSEFSAIITVPTPIVGYDYTVILAKKGVKFNERNKWTATVTAASTDVEDIVDAFVDQFNAVSANTGVVANNAGNGELELSCEDGTYTDYNVIGADELEGVEVAITPGCAPMLDADYVKDLASQCAAGKGFNYLSEDGKDIYPGYPEPIDSDKYIMFTLRFAVPRVGAKTRDEVVYQLVHIVVPGEGMSGAEGLAGTIASILSDYITVYPEN